MRTAADILKNNVHDIASVPADTILFDALILMSKKKVGAMLVKTGEEYVGIWTERDLMRQVIQDGFDLKTAKIGDYMVTDLKYSDASETAYDMMDKFLGLRLRHLLIKEEGQVIGVLSIGDVIKATLREKKDEIESLNTLVSWEYYEEWKPKTVE
jgi:signal-transduction protein with cAMP-binding, CBS, and nucleotidyltransferase domain